MLELKRKEPVYSSTALQGNSPDSYRIGFQRLPELLDRFPAIHLDQVGSASLLNRQETKYILRQETILSLLPGLESDYAVLEIAGRRISRYSSTYYDTPDRLFYRQHHSGTQPRWKVRHRTYLDSGSSFLEIKQKDNHSRTRKNRWESPDDLSRLPGSMINITDMDLPVSPHQLSPTLDTSYSRVTLVHNNHRERVTLDFQLVFAAGWKSRALAGLMIAEIKQDSRNRQSPFIEQLRNASIRPVSFSKYCIGSALIYPDLKFNRFKPMLKKINSFITGGIVYGQAL